MSTTDSPPPPAPGSGPRISSQEARDLGTLRRTTKASPEGRHVAGVAGGLARHFDIDPVLVRVLLVVLVFFGGAGLLLYGAGWLLIPEEGSEHAAVSLDDRNRSLALYVAGGLAALALLGDTVGSFHFPWPLAIIALLVLLVMSRRDRFRAGQRRSAAPVPPPVYGPAPFGPATSGAAAYGPEAYGPAPYDAPTDAPTDAPAPYDDPNRPAPYLPPPPPYVPQPNPRRRGPILFWFTLALIALLLGTLGIIDGAGAPISDSAYPALAVGITGAMLVLGAFWGRAGGLILIGLVSTVALAGTVAADEYDGRGDHVHAVPVVASGLASDYDIGAGELKVDLTEISDLAALDGRTLDLSGGVGSIQVTVPDDLNVVFSGDVHGPGHIEFFDDDRGGIDTSMDRTHRVASGAPTLTIDAELGVGEISVRSE
jgi:phage shock protein PspC (stress-responsive transcriptional regulator)